MSNPKSTTFGSALASFRFRTELVDSERIEVMFLKVIPALN